MAEIIITEKPNAAQKVASALADDKPKKESKNSVPYYRLTYNGRDIIVACAVGHLFTVGQKEKTSWNTYPIYEVEWVPTADADSSAAYTRKYLNVLKSLAKESDEITVACDFDIEGEVIGLNVIRHIFKASDAARMKFSTLTTQELKQAYQEKSDSLSWGQANAGETRHILDFYYGINLTRALTHAINSVRGGFKVLSSGRVQGPALKTLVDREKEIQQFTPVPYWQIMLEGTLKEKAIEAFHKSDKFWEKENADQVMRNVEGAQEGKIAKTEKRRFTQKPPVPFDLTALQVEAYRCFKIRPKQTLDIAQKLYTSGFISYPRTSSQKLPKQIGYKKILTNLGKQPEYANLAQKLLSRSELSPNQGKKTDDAHPAIYPTGNAPDGLEGRDQKVYDLVVKRFFAVFADEAHRETHTLTIDVSGEEFSTKGTTTVEKGWHEFYAPYVKIDETELPSVEKGDPIQLSGITLQDKETKPPNRYTQSSIVHELEKRGLGTKATRAQVVETLLQRGYVTGDNNLQATEIGIKTADTLLKYCPRIVDEELTREFENEMELIRQRQKQPQEVLDRAKEVLNDIIDTFRNNEQNIGSELSEANEEHIKKETNIGPCPNCENGQLVIRKGKFGRFAACNNYPECKTTFALPNKGTVKPTEKKCEQCSMPLVHVRMPNRGGQELCINNDCPSKSDANAREQYPEEGMTCPACQKGKMVLRKGFYGQFLGCDNYPKCKTMMKIVEGKVDSENPITQTNSKKKSTKKGTSTKKKSASSSSETSSSQSTKKKSSTKKSSSQTATKKKKSASSSTTKKSSTKKGASTKKKSS